ncbi:dihydrofolate reductase [Pancytospora philotis]|nr:dihydrofolate reductase [Pancytospora philotis]
MPSKNHSKLVDFVRSDVNNAGDESWLAKDRLNLVVAYTDAHRYIGYEGDLPWKRKLRGDANFVNTLIRLVPGCVLIMGRNTYESMPVKDRITQIVLTRQPDFTPSGAIVLNDFKTAVQYCEEHGLYPIVFGGSRVYELALGYPCRIFHTIVEEGELQGDTVYPGHDDVIVSSFNITGKVEQLLLARTIPKTWELDGEQFVENGFRYGFYVSEN